MGDPIKNLNFFKKIGLNEWFICDEKFENFFTWLSNNITEDNILSDLELREYDEICQEGNALSETDVQLELERLNSTFPNFLEYTEDNVEEWESKLEEIAEIEELYESMNLKSTEQQIRKDLLSIEQNISICEDEEDNLFKECMDNAKKLQDAELLNQKTLDDLNQCYIRSQIPHLFMFQMPFDQYYLKCDTFVKYLDVYFQNNFKNQNFLEIESDNMIHELDVIREKLFKSQYKLIMAKARENVEKRILDLSHSNCYPMSSKDLENATSELISTINRYDNERELLESDLKVKLRKLSILESELIIYEHNKSKLQRAENRLENLQKFSEMVTNGLLNAEVLWLLLQFDLEKVKKRNLFYSSIDDKITESQLCMKRIDSMNILLKKPFESQIHRYFYQKFATLLIHYNNVPSQNLNNLKDCLIEYDNVLKSTADQLNFVLNGNHYEEIFNFIQSINQMEQLLKTYIIDGPVNKPIYWNLKFFEQIFEINKEKVKNQDQLNILKNQSYGYSNRDNNDRFWHNKEILWILFLTEPMKMMRAIDIIIREVKLLETRSTKANKALAGIMRKQ